MRNLGKFINIHTCIIANIFGVVIGFFMLFVGYNHNIQGEFTDIETGQIDYIYSLLIFASWYILSILVICGIVFIVKFLRFLLNKLKS
jgi:hypothetical protein